MSKFSDYMQNKPVSKGGMLGGLIGALVSGKSYSANDTILKKAGKTGIFAALGYILGDFLERFIAKRRNHRTF
jgi:hypothetical protein